MSGSDPDMQNDDAGREWLVLKDEMTEETVGYVDASGHVKDADPATEQRVKDAFARDLLVQDGEVVEELGMCFDGVCAIRPVDPGHDALVLRNLGALTGLRPERREDPETGS